MGLAASKTGSFGILLLLPLTACVQSFQLDAIHRGDPPKGRASDDHPRVNLKNDSVKRSFVEFLGNECTNDSLKDSSVSKAPSDSWASKNPRSAACVNRITAYAIDQCEWMTRQQNSVSITTTLAIEAVDAGAALATDVAFLAHPQDAKNSSAVLIASNVLSNGDKIKGLGTTSVPFKEFGGVGFSYAELINLNDAKDQVDQSVKSNDSKDETLRKLARVHDAVLSVCTANAIAFPRFVKK